MENFQVHLEGYDESTDDALQPTCDQSLLKATKTEISEQNAWITIWISLQNNTA